MVILGSDPFSCTNLFYIDFISGKNEYYKRDKNKGQILSHMRNATSDEDLYFWGMFKNKWDNRFKKEKIIACSQCGSKRIHKVTAQEPVFVKLDIPFKCEDCGYQGKPMEFDSEKNYKKFIKKLK